MSKGMTCLFIPFLLSGTVTDSKKAERDTATQKHHEDQKDVSIDFLCQAHLGALRQRPPFGVGASVHLFIAIS